MHVRAEGLRGGTHWDVGLYVGPIGEYNGGKWWRYTQRERERDWDVWWNSNSHQLAYGRFHQNRTHSEINAHEGWLWRSLFVLITARCGDQWPGVSGGTVCGAPGEAPFSPVPPTLDTNARWLATQPLSGQQKARASSVNGVNGKLRLSRESGPIVSKKSTVSAANCSRQRYWLSLAEQFHCHTAWARMNRPPSLTH